MFKIFILPTLLLLLSLKGLAQYYKGELYVRLSPDAAAIIIDREGNPDTSQFRLLFTDMVGPVSFSKVRVPFFKASGSPVQRVVHFQFYATLEIEELCAALSRMPEIEYAERVPVVHFDTFIPNDLGEHSYEEQWYLHQIQAPGAWAIGRGSRDIKVAVVDQAVDISHPDLQELIWTNPAEIPGNGIDDDDNGYIDDVHGYDVASGDPDPSPDHPGQTHGTHVAGLVSAQADNGIGIASIGFGLSIVPVKCEYSNSSGSIPYEGVVYAANVGADIINCSWGGYSSSITHQNIIAFAQDKGCLMVCSAGNDGLDVLGYPAAYPGVISVGATTILDRMATFTNYNEQLSVSAPGNNILSTLPNNQYGNYSGTSMSSPIVSGLLGLMKSHYPQISNEQLTHCLLSTTDSVVIHQERYEGKTGTGRINALRAMQCVDALKLAATDLHDLTRAKEPLLLYPNPASDQVYMALRNGQSASMSLRVSDALGRVMLHRELSPAQLHGAHSFSVAGWPAGVYFVALMQGGRSSQGKFVVR